MFDTIEIFKELLFADSNHIQLDIFPKNTLRCDKVAIIYSKKKKLFMWLGLNDNYTGFILYKDKDLYKLANVARVDINQKFPKFHINENSNRLICSLLDKLYNLTSNPVHIYKTSELFSK